MYVRMDVNVYVTIDVGTCVTSCFSYPPLSFVLVCDEYVSWGNISDRTAAIVFDKKFTKLWNRKEKKMKRNLPQYFHPCKYCCWPLLHWETVLCLWVSPRNILSRVLLLFSERIWHLSLSTILQVSIHSFEIGQVGELLWRKQKNAKPKSYDDNFLFFKTSVY